VDEELQTGAATILIAEDEHEIRTLAVLILEEQGYRVLEAAGATEAIRLFESNPRIDLAVIDIWLPEMRGVELATHLRDVRPELKFLYLAGFAARISKKERTFINPSPILKKPFEKSALLDCVGKLLSARQIG
jgi:two-component system, cell cycle sensor histidine kinase and response regulator CckA